MKFSPFISAPVLFFVATLACAADGSIYAFVNNQGDVFLSNVPDNDNYRVLISTEARSIGVVEHDTPDLRGPLKSRQSYGAMIEQAAGEFGVDAALLHAVIAVESGYNPNALSRRGAGGLMQLMPDTAKRYGVANVFDPLDNVRGGAQYLAELNKLFRKNMPLVIAAYNAGEHVVLRYGNHIPPYRETTAYVAQVIAFYQKSRL